jgi:hypothetical protein
MKSGTQCYPDAAIDEMSADVLEDLIAFEKLDVEPRERKRLRRLQRAVAVRLDARGQLLSSLSALTRERDVTIAGARARYAAGKLTVAQEGDGWIALEDGHRVGGTLRQPFASREDAERWVQRELAGEVDAEANAMAKIIREADPEMWARFQEVQDAYPDDDAARYAAHRVAGTGQLLTRLSHASLEASGRVCRRTFGGQARWNLTMTCQ